VHEHWSDTDRLKQEERLEPDLGGDGLMSGSGASGRRSDSSIVIA